jgi:probable phosphoglycerate mutase
MTKLYLLRHGAIEWPEADCFIGQTDAPLSKEGRLQARDWRNELPGLGFSVVWSSDLSRTLETAEIIFGGCSTEIRTCSQLREIRLGEWDGVPRSRIRGHHPHLWTARGKDLAGFTPPGGESFRDLQNRAVAQVLQIAEQSPACACIVTHAGVIRVLICYFLQIPLPNLFRIHLDYGSLSIVSYTSERVEVCGLNLRVHEEINSQI